MQVSESFVKWTHHNTAKALNVFNHLNKAFSFIVFAEAVGACYYRKSLTGRFVPILGSATFILGIFLHYTKKFVEEVDKGTHPCDICKTRLLTFHDIVKQGNLEIIEFHVSKGADVNALDVEGYSAFHYAVVEGKKEIVEYLLNHGADVEVVTKEFVVKDDGSEFPLENTPLHLAAMYGHLKVVSLLITQNPELNKKNALNWTPIEFAADNGWQDVMDLLQKSGASESEFESYKQVHTFQQVVCDASLEIIQLHLKRGANANAIDKEGYSSFHYAIMKGRLDIVELLVENGADIHAKNQKTDYYSNASTRTENSPLHFAARHGFEDILKLLLKKRAKKEAKNSDNRTAEEIAYQYGWSELMPLLRFTEEENPIKDNSLPLLHTATTVKGVELVLNAGANIGGRDLEGKIALHEMSSKDAIEAIDYLVELDGPLVNARDIEGNTPLHEAAIDSSEKTMDLLLNRGARLNEENNRMQTPLNIALENGNLYTTQFLLQKGAILNPLGVDKDGDPFLHCLMSKIFKDPSKVDEWFTVLEEVFSKNKIEINQTNLKGQSALHVAVYHDKTKEFKGIAFLIKKGIEIDSKDGEDLTSLHRAAYAGREDVCEYLIGNNADPTILFGERSYLDLLEERKKVRLEERKKVRLEERKKQEGNTGRGGKSQSASRGTNAHNIK